ncbi:MAG TPA: glutathione peroxidase [Candidatus Acidoferrales bacterium]|nr:glutathione peroxidase [Candidatus Acidoferrales bacterium]
MPPSEESLAGPTEGLRDIQVQRIGGEIVSMGDFEGKVLLVVNVASRCGYTPQYAALQGLQERYGGSGFTVMGFPCNQFLFQEPGGADRIQRFCATRYGVTFPLFAKIKVRGRNSHPLYRRLSSQPDGTGSSGQVRWNFEKFLVGRDGRVSARFRSKVEPDDPMLVAALEERLRAGGPARGPAA